MSAYESVTRWSFAAPIERVFREIDEVQQWPSWWPGVVAVELLAPGSPSPERLGYTVRTTWKSRLPYRVRIVTSTVSYEAPHLIEVHSSGDLNGAGRWRLCPAGGGTLVTFEWSVTPTARWLNALTPIARPLFAWNHAVLMRWGGEALGRRLGVAHSRPPP